MLAPVASMSHPLVVTGSPGPTVASPVASDTGPAGLPSPTPKGKATRTYTEEQHERRVAWGEKWGPLNAAAIKQALGEAR